MKSRAYNLALALVALTVLVGSPVQAADRVPNDTYYSEQWYLNHIGVPEAWNRSLGLESIIIAVIDSGVDIDHPDLKDNVWRNQGEIAGNGIDDDRNGYVDDAFGWDFVDGDNDPRPDLTGKLTVLGANHGTVNAGVAAARGDNGKGITGVTWQSSIMALRVLDSSGAGDPDAVARAVKYAVANGARVINLSFVGTRYSATLRDTLRAAYDSGVFIVAAAGNAPDGGTPTDLDQKPLYPICLDLGDSENFIYGVTATDDHDRKADFANYGSGCVDGSAPGVRVLSTQVYRPGTTYFGSPYGGFYNGTSVAAPVVSGVAALILALDRNLTPKQITNLLTESAVKINDLNPEFAGRLGRGRIDVTKALQVLLGDGKPASAPTVATADLLPPGASSQVIVASPGAGRDPEVRLYTQDGTFVRGFLAYAKSFHGGVSSTLANFSGHLHDTIVTGAGPGGGPHVRTFDINTNPLGGFMAYDPAFRGGVNVATGDVDGDGRDEIVTGAGPGGGPHVRVFTAGGSPISGFFAFDPRKRTGTDVAAGDLDGDGRAEIAASAPDATTVRVFDPRGKLLAEFAPFGRGVARGASKVTIADLDGNGRAEIVITKAGTGGMRVSAYRMNGELVAEYDLAAGGGSKALFGVIGAVSGTAPTIDMLGRAALTFFAFEPKFRGGVSAAIVQ